MYDFHKSKVKYFEIQKRVTKEYIIPYIKTMRPIPPTTRVLEIGCAEAGVLAAFLEKGCERVVGIELSASRVELAKNFLKKWIDEGKADIINKNIYDLEPSSSFQFDIVILKDVIEHIPNQEVFIGHLKKLVAPGGLVFFAYPPWQMPFGGHQQILSNPILQKLPWFHLLPMSWYLGILKWAKENPATIKELKEIKETGISIQELKRYLSSNDAKVIKETYWLTNPIYTFKFNISPLVLPSLLAKIPLLNNFLTTAHYVLFEFENS